MVFWVLGVYRVRDAEAAAASYKTSRDVRRAAGQKSYRVFKVTNAPEGETKVGRPARLRDSGGRATFAPHTGAISTALRACPSKCCWRRPGA